LLFSAIGGREVKEEILGKQAGLALGVAAAHSAEGDAECSVPARDQATSPRARRK
jgi:hypothetical protein